MKYKQFRIVQKFFIDILMKDMYMFTKNDVYEYDSFIDLKKFRGVHVV